MPDLGISTLDDVLIDVRRITDVCSLPLLVDVDTGWGGAFNIARTVKSLTKMGAAGMHIGGQQYQVKFKDAGERSDLEAGMAKLFASEAGKEVVEDSFRIHGGYGYSKEYEIERLYRDAPLLLIGEGTSEIQRMLIGRKLLERNKI